MDNSFIFLNRSIKNSSIYKKPNARALFIHLLLSVNYKETKIPYKDKDIYIPRGSLVTGRKKLSEECVMSEKQVRTALSYLEKTERIKIISKNKFSIITILKWDEYQKKGQVEGQVDNGDFKHKNCKKTEGRGQVEGQQRANKGPTKGQQRATIQEYKELKKENNIIKKTTNNMDLPEEKKIKELEGIMSNEDLKALSSLVSIKKLIIKEKLLSNSSNDALKAILSSNKGLLDDVASLYTEIQSLEFTGNSSSVMNIPKYKRSVINGIMGRLDKQWEIYEVIEDVISYIDNRINQVLSFYCKINKEKSKINESKKNDDIRKISEKAFSSLSNPEKAAIAEEALKSVRSEMGTAKYMVNREHRVVKERIYNILNNRGYIDEFLNEYDKNKEEVNV